MKKCPFCADYVPNAAAVCKHCGRDLPADLQPQSYRLAAIGLVAVVVVGIGVLSVLAWLAG